MCPHVSPSRLVYSLVLALPEFRIRRVDEDLMATLF